MKRQLLFFILIISATTASAEWLNRGYLKYGFNYLDFPSHSTYALFGEEQQNYQRFSGRLMAEKDWSSFTFAGHYDMQYTFAHQETLSSFSETDPGNLFDLTSFIVDEKKQTLMHRIDRLYVHYRGKQVSLKVGRQALTWGHGMMFQTMDIFNPFSPVALDTDYKAGNDMFWSEWLTNRGDDIQTLMVPRKNESDDVDIDASAIATKYHGLLFDTDFDLLLARNNTIELVAFGLARPIKQSMWRMDVVGSRLDDGNLGFSVVSNLDYSWIWFDHNIYGFIEYMYDSEGFRNQGGLLLTDKHYSAASLRIELHPLVNISPSVISNLKDNSGLFYLTLFYDWMQDFNLSSSVIVPYGSESSEFAGANTPGTSFQILLSAYF